MVQQFLQRYDFPIASFTRVFDYSMHAPNTIGVVAGPRSICTATCVCHKSHQISRR